MTNYASISEAIAKKLNEAEAEFYRLDIAVSITDKKVRDLEIRYISGENVGDELDEAYDEHEKTFDAYDKARYICAELKEAREAYIEVMRHIEHANYAECNW